MTGKCPTWARHAGGRSGSSTLSVPSRSPKRCRHTVWPVEVVAATGGGIGVAMEDLAMRRAHAADRLMALSEQSRKLAQRERQWVKDRLVAP